MRDAAAKPKTEMIAARVPQLIHRERMNRIDGPGEAFSAHADNMNNAIVLPLGIAMRTTTPRRGWFASDGLEFQKTPLPHLELFRCRLRCGTHRSWRCRGPFRERP